MHAWERPGLIVFVAATPDSLAKAIELAEDPSRAAAQASHPRSGSLILFDQAALCLKMAQEAN